MAKAGAISGPRSANAAEYSPASFQPDVPMRRLEVTVRVLVEAENHLGALDHDRPPDQVGIFHHEIDRFLLRGGQRTLLEYRTPQADVIQEVISLDVLLEKLPRRRRLVDVYFVYRDPGRVQITSGVLAGRSRRFPVERWFCHLHRIMKDGC
jgi:hypothetical protein